MFYTKVLPDDMKSRLDANFYRPEYLEIERKLEKLGSTSLDTLCSGVECGPFGGNAIADDLYAENGIAFIRPVNISSQIFDDSSLVKVPEAALIERNLKIYDGINLYFGRVGDPCVAIIDRKTSISPNIIIAKTDYRLADPYYLYAFSSCNFGIKQILRQLKTVAQPTTSTEAVRSLSVYKANPITQKYIGDKVRQAEELRAWAKNQKSKLKALESQIPATKLDTSDSKVSLANLSFLTENRLDARYYSKKHLNLYSQFSSDFVSLGDICSGFKYGASIAANYVEQDGLPFIRGNALYANGINREDIVYLDKSMQKELKSAFVNEGDILMTRSGTVGVTTFVGSDYSKFWYGSFIIKCNLVNDKYIPEYVSWFLNSWVGQQQFRRLENGAVQLNVNIEELNSIYVWDASDQFQTLVKQLIENEVSAINASKHLISIAKTLVEALIEGQLTEGQLIQAQQALEDGDNTLDKAILSKLSNEGYAVEGATPLFSDIDELYRLLASANAADDSEE